MTLEEIKTIEDVLKVVQETIANDAEIEHFCQLKYAKSFKVFQGIDEDNPPTQSDYPIVAIFSINRARRGESSKFVEYDVAIGIGVLNEKKEVDGNKITYPGMAEAERLRELVEASIFGKVAHKVDVSGETSSEIIFPLFRSDTIVRLSYVQTNREAVK